jgi:hypothetical protein
MLIKLLKYFKYCNTVKRFKLKKLKFDNFFNFGSGNEIDYTKLENIVGLDGSSFIGKSTARHHAVFSAPCRAACRTD